MRRIFLFLTLLLVFFAPSATPQTQQRSQADGSSPAPVAHEVSPPKVDCTNNGTYVNRSGKVVQTASKPVRHPPQELLHNVGMAATASAKVTEKRAPITVVSPDGYDDTRTA